MVLDRYIAKTVVSGCLIASFVMLSIFAFVDFVTQLNSVGTGDYGALQAAIFVFLQLPQRLYDLSPSILLLGGILSLGAMAANSELIVMRASGVSTMRITRSVLQTGFIIAIMVALLGEYIVPSATRTAKTYRAQAMENKLIVGGGSDVWARDGNRYIHVKKILPDHQLRDIHLYELDDNRQLNAMVYAKRAHYQNNEWVLDEIKRSEISSMGVTTTFKKQLKLKKLILLELFTVLELRSRDMSATELLTYSQYLQDNKLDDGEYRLAFWIKIFTPFTCLAMLMIAMPIVFSTTPRSGGIGQRLMLAVFIGVAYFVINRSINHLGLALNVAPILSAVIPLFLVMLISLYFMKRVN
ncbi:FIG000906: Predicted Permease [hydrothermal vent metagenome]|uniref:FIG000906: Predicted Permease n=1 Tax=hydrothermal vent metagenome TaxID=652676 RepID=A0A3B0WEG4_9ZZZZ